MLDFSRLSWYHARNRSAPRFRPQGDGSLIPQNRAAEETVHREDSMNSTDTKQPRSVRKIKTSRSFNDFLRLTLGRWLVRKYNMRAENAGLFDSLQAPYLILPNHMSFWDPFCVSNYVPDPVYYVTSDANFRSPVLRFLLGLVGSIPKTKQMSDLETIKHILRIRDSKGVIGIFPEGRRSWDGHTLPLLYSTAKLVKMLKIPVVTVVFKGAYLSLPRWTKRSRRGELTLSYSLALTAQECASLGADEIFARITSALEFDEFAWQRERMIPFRGKKLAENLELTLFACPACGAIGTLQSDGDTLSCTGCGYAVRYTEYGFFEPCSGALHHDTVRSWNLWQQEHLSRYVTERHAAGDGQPVLRDANTLLLTGYKSAPLKKAFFGEIVLYADRIEFVPLRRRRLVFPLDQIAGMNVQNNERLEFYFGGTLFRFHFASRHVSSYKWVSACAALCGITSSKAIVERPS